MKYGILWERLEEESGGGVCVRQNYKQMWLKNLTFFIKGRIQKTLQLFNFCPLPFPVTNEYHVVVLLQLRKWSMLSVLLLSSGCTREAVMAREKRLSGTRHS